MRRSTLAQRIVVVLWRNRDRPSDWPEEFRADCQAIRDRYEELKGEMGFTEAAERAQVEWVERVLVEDA